MLMNETEEEIRCQGRLLFAVERVVEKGNRAEEKLC